MSEPDTPKRKPARVNYDSEEFDSEETRVLTVNQLVAYNLMRARRSKGWTQEETAERLRRASGRRWTAATLSAAERSWETDRPREFDANEIATFATVFEQPIGYFFLPLRSDKKLSVVCYGLSRKENGDTTHTVWMKNVLEAAVPLRYPAQLVDDVNRLLAPRGITWSPVARVEWLEEDDQWDAVVAAQLREEAKNVTDAGESAIIEAFAEILHRRHSQQSHVLRELSEAVSRLEVKPRQQDREEPPF